MIIDINVSDLPAPEPLSRILELLKAKEEIDIICMIHRQVPYKLFDFLKQSNHQAKMIEQGGYVVIYIWNDSNTAALELIERDKSRVKC